MASFYRAVRACFGVACQQVTDFTLLDFFYMQPKLHLKIREAVLRGEASDAKSRASGYSHRYFNSPGIDLAALATFPFDAEIESLSDVAAQEAESLVQLLGVNAEQLLRTSQGSSLPGIRAWYSSAEQSNSDTDSSIDKSDYKDEDNNDVDQLRDIIRRDQEDAPSRTDADDQRVTALTCASAALSIDHWMKV